ncbi:winged helix-turn-helix transcriptional regulator [Lentzea sp. NPDC058450]|uniref:winged helix-turn-helix transcriptional regulator n=1 Tax=Lentzea sp. NPDC058450 TaxID=3346505 RepID=UPI00365D8EBC
MAAAKRDYGQFCGLAAALNVIGERWTLLVLRELLIGPARFTELAANLPGAGPNLLAERLRTLAEHGIVGQTLLEDDGRARQYHLTELGEQLRGPVLALAHWGLGFLREEDRTGAVRAEWGFLAVQAMVDEGAIPDVDETYEFQVGAEPFVIEVRGGAVAFGRGHAEEPDLTVECDADTFVRIGARMLSPFEAIATGDVRIKGKAESVRRCVQMLGLS